MIQIDDAGSGSLIGGTCIGVYDTNSNNYYYDIIPIELYKYEMFNKKLYLDYVVDIVQKAFNVFNINGTEQIEICRGYMFEKLRYWLDDNNFDWHNTVITGILQQKVEDTFNNHAISLGFPIQYIKYTKYPFHFHRILKWVYADYEKRSINCKTGWKSWDKYGKQTPKIDIGYVDDKRTYYCLKCGRKLNPNCQIKIIRYTSNKENTIYIHKKCYQR